jgi:hypothetical protein
MQQAVVETVSKAMEMEAQVSVDQALLLVQSTQVVVVEEVLLVDQV